MNFEKWWKINIENALDVDKNLMVLLRAIGVRAWNAGYNEGYDIGHADGEKAALEEEYF